MPDPVIPGIGKTRLGQRILECVFSIGTRSAQSIRASGHIGRINRSYEGGSSRLGCPAIPNWRIF
jgi:hypothetical protein